MIMSDCVIMIMSTITIPSKMDPVLRIVGFQLRVFDHGEFGL